MKRILLIDADILAYKVAAMNEKTFDFGEGGVACVLSPEKVVADSQETLDDLVSTLDADGYRIILSDPKKNWRKNLDPTYKDNRKSAKKPALLMDVKDFLYKANQSTYIKWLEGDDVMGIMATNPERKAEFVIVSEDKDMRTIPGLVYHPHRPEQGVMEITRDDADRFLLWQTICGDPGDGYPGCRGLGKTSLYAQEIIEGDFDDPLDMWDLVIDAYASKGFREEHALLQARLACICRWTNWDPNKRQVRLWNPLHLLYKNQ